MKTILDRLEDKMLIGDDCWEWTAAKSPLGYGALNVGDRTKLAHRVVYELLVGSIPDGLDLDHLCRNPSCVKPAHLEPVPRAENLRRGDRPHARKTHCPQGHPYSGDNLYIPPNGDRICVTCKRKYGREYMRRMRNQ